MADPDAVAVTEIERGIVLDILRRHMAGMEVWAFGSRVSGTPKPWSDLDLALMSNAPIAMTHIADLREAFAESDLPWKVDLVDWSVTTPVFRDLIAARHVVLQEKGT